MPREIVFTEAKRDSFPLLIGLVGPSGSGKTYSALRIATAIAEVMGGPINFVDTEANRAKQYADEFRFRHFPFTPPHSPDDYLEAIRASGRSGAAVTVIDSMSHEHEGEGGVLAMHDEELETFRERARASGSRDPDWKIDERNNSRAWIRPKAARRRLINGILQTPGSFIFCFRAKQVAKPRKLANGKTEIVNTGWIPIAGDEFVFEMTARFLLPPASAGVPRWTSEEADEKAILKLPGPFRPYFLKERLGKPLDEEAGRWMAKWASGRDRDGQVATGGSSRRDPERPGPGRQEPAPEDAGPCWEPMGDSRCGLPLGHDGEHEPEE